MIVRSLEDAERTDRRVVAGNWESTRLLLKGDGMGFSFHITTIYPGTETCIWYKNHLESVFCIEGEGEVEVLEELAGDSGTHGGGADGGGEDGRWSDGGVLDGGDLGDGSGDGVSQGVKGDGGEGDGRNGGKIYRIAPGTIYILDRHDRHLLRARTPLKLACVFNPPLCGKEVHDPDGAYPLEAEEVAD